MYTSIPVALIREMQITQTTLEIARHSFGLFIFFLTQGKRHVLCTKHSEKSVINGVCGVMWRLQPGLTSDSTA